MPDERLRAAADESPAGVIARATPAIRKARSSRHRLRARHQALQDLVELPRRDGRADVVALDLGAAFELEHLQLLARLHAFGGGVDAEAAAETGDGADDGEAILPVGDVARER